MLRHVVVFDQHINHRETRQTETASVRRTVGGTNQKTHITKEHAEQANPHFLAYWLAELCILKKEEHDMYIIQKA